MNNGMPQRQWKDFASTLALHYTSRKILPYTKWSWNRVPLVNVTQEAYYHDNFALLPNTEGMTCPQTRNVTEALVATLLAFISCACSFLSGLNYRKQLEKSKHCHAVRTALEHVRCTRSSRNLHFLSAVQCTSLQMWAFYTRFAEATHHSWCYGHRSIWRNFKTVMVFLLHEKECTGFIA